MSSGVTAPRAAARLRPSSRRVAVRRAVALGAFVVLLAVAVGIVYAGSPTRLADGTRVGGVDVGGLTVNGALSLLRERAEAVERTPIAFVAGGRTWSLSASQLGLRSDWSAALQAAEGESDGFGPVRGFRRIQTRIFGAEVAPPVSVYPSVLAFKIDQVARAVERPAVEASIRRAGLSVSIVGGRGGARLDRKAAAELVVRSLASFERSGPVKLPMTLTRPKLNPSDLSRGLAKARVALSGAATLSLGPTRWQVPRWRIAGILSLPARGATEPVIAGRGAERWLTELARSVNREPADATFRVRPGGIEIVPGREGRSLDIPATIAAVERAVFSATNRTAGLVVRTAQPERSTDDAKAMGITGVVGSYTTSYGGTPGRIHNVQLVADLIDGALVEPGGTFSFNETTGERNEAKGFESAPVIINGELQNGIGGGVCQVSTTVFNAAFVAGLPIGRRTNHALYISHYPLGRDATVNYPDLDLTFSNDTGRWLLVRTFVNAGSLTVNLYGAPQNRVVETETAPLTVTGKIPIDRVDDPKLFKGKRVVETIGTPPRETSVLRRVLSPQGELLYENTWRSVYVGEPTIVRVGTKPRPKPKHAPGPTRTPPPTADVGPVTGERVEPALP